MMVITPYITRHGFRKVLKLLRRGVFSDYLFRAEI